MTSFLLQARGNWVNPPNTDEIWQVGIRLWADTSVPDDIGTFPALTITEDSVNTSNDQGPVSSNWTNPALDPIGYLDQASAAWQIFHPAAYVGTKCRLTELRLYPIDSTGKAVQLPSGTAVAIQTFDPAVVGSRGDALLPLEVAMGISWTTYINNQKGRGRIYYPGQTVASLGTEGRFDGTVLETITTAAATLLSDLAVESADPTDPHLRPVVTGPSNWAAYSVIRRVRVGNVPDSQRRRRNRVSEVYSGADVTYG